VPRLIARRLLLPLWPLLLLSACEPGGAMPGGDGSMLPGDGGPIAGPDGSAASKARLLSEKLGGAHADHFLIGVGNDGTNSGDDDAYHLGAAVDLHYHYLTGVGSAGGWVTWNANPDYAGKRIGEAAKHGMITLLTVYMMASWGDGNIKAELESAPFMAEYFKDYLQLLATAKGSTTPVVLHVEPDFWGYAQQQSVDAGGPDKIVVRVDQAGQPECAGEPNTLVGFAHCLLALTRARAPSALVGFHASVWGSKMDTGGNTDPKLDVAAEAAKSAQFFTALGLRGADYIATDISDRDAGCYEAGHLPMCPKRSNVYWDESNQTLPSFKQHFTWARALSDGLDLPIVWWQLPYGAPSANTGGSVGMWRDNRVHYFFAHPDELVAAGGVAALWGVGAGDQTYLTTEFKTAVAQYYQSPLPLP